MFTFKEDTTIVGVSELRSNFNKVIEIMKKTKVMLGKRNKPVAVIVPIERYNKMEEVIEEIEDLEYGLIAKERYENSRPEDYIDIAEVKKLIEDAEKKRRKAAHDKNPYLSRIPLAVLRDKKSRHFTGKRGTSQSTRTKRKQ